MLTRKQKQLYDYLRAQAVDDVCPSFEDMREALGLSSKSGIARLITALEERGFIERIPNRARAIRVLEKAARVIDAKPPALMQSFATRDLVKEMQRRGYVVTVPPPSARNQFMPVQAA